MAQGLHLGDPSMRDKASSGGLFRAEDAGRSRPRTQLSRKLLKRWLRWLHYLIIHRQRRLYKGLTNESLFSR
jgi:hypothetical protein